jgi:hypothetical protein
MSPGQPARRFPFPKGPSPASKLKRQDARNSKGVIVENKTSLSALAIFAVQNTHGFEWDSGASSEEFLRLLLNPYPVVVFDGKL